MKLFTTALVSALVGLAASNPFGPPIHDGPNPHVPTSATASSTSSTGEGALNRCLGCPRPIPTGPPFVGRHDSVPQECAAGSTICVGNDIYMGQDGACVLNNYCTRCQERGGQAFCV